MISDNDPNKSWWDKNPMSYVGAKKIEDWSDEARFLQEKDQFEEMNKKYLDTNPALKRFFTEGGAAVSLKNKKVLDIGTGWGSSALLLEACGCRVNAIDLSDSSISGARKNVAYFGQGNIEIETMDAEALDFPNEFFDFIYSWGVIHHSCSTEYIVAEISRVLKPGGGGMVMVYNRHSTRYYLLGLYFLLVKGKIFKGESLRSVQRFFTDGYWHRHFSPKEFILLLATQGLKAQKVEISYMARRILPGIKEGSALDEWLKSRFGWLLVVHFSKQMA